MTLFRQFFFSLLLCLSLNSSPLLGELNRFMVVTPEKSGTHLLTKTLELMTGKQTRNCWLHTLKPHQLADELAEAERTNAFLQMHALPTPEIINTLKSHGYKVIFLMRDPRDVTLSLLFYIEKGWAYGPFKNSLPKFGSLSFDQKLLEMITGARSGITAPHDVIVRRMPWMDEDPSFVYTAHFENLVGSNGGGSQEAQYQELANISTFIGLDADFETIQKIAQDSYGKPGEKTFREGQIGSWKRHYKSMHAMAFSIIYGSILIDLGYETDTDWAFHFIK